MACWLVVGLPAYKFMDKLKVRHIVVVYCVCISVAYVMLI